MRWPQPSVVRALSEPCQSLTASATFSTVTELVVHLAFAADQGRQHLWGCPVRGG